MRFIAAVLLASLGSVACGWSATFTVTNTQNSGAGSLRKAIQDANGSLGSTIAFAASLSGKKIAPTTALPAVTAENTTIDGDLNNDGRPDIVLDGVNLSAGAGVGLMVQGAPGCDVIGLCIINCPDTGLLLKAAFGAEVRSCYFGITLTSGLSNTNGRPAGVAGEQVELLVTDSAKIGGSAPTDRNYFHCGAPGDGNVGLRLVGSRSNTVVGNWFGLTQDGLSAWSGQNIGVMLERSSTGRTCRSNLIGGEITTGEPNYFGWCRRGVSLDRAHYNRVRGNYFGLAKNRNTALPINETCVHIGTSCSENTIGGSPSERNVFVSQSRGVTIQGPSAVGTQIESNWFGANGAGNGHRVMGVCVDLLQDAGLHTIGSSDPARYNVLAPNGTSQPVGVELWYSGGGARILNNIFGELPNATPAIPADAAIYCVGASPVIRGNRITRALRGLEVLKSTSDPQVYDNRFVDCSAAVRLRDGAQCRLGNLGNTNTTDNGANIFRDIDTWFIYNNTTHAVKAEGNDFDTTSAAAIDAKIWDQLDNASRGRVDYNPLIGGVAPTGGTEAVWVSGATALPTAGGAEIAFTLSAAARVTVTVLNVAGRPIATVVQDRPAEAGLQRVVWNGQSAAGTRAPGGLYLVRIEAWDAAGQTSRAVARLVLAR
ncbi:MAG: hypothetical protein FJX74_01455 [Armatimonadetes bacterium]|nr:hypothetical protein [Armatimonadota bacterium]